MKTDKIKEPHHRESSMELPGPKDRHGGAKRSVGGMLLVLQVAALLRQRNEVGEDHSTEADVEEGIDGARLDVLGVVIVQALADRLLRVIDREHRLQMRRKILHFHPFYLVVEAPHRHFSPLQIEIEILRNSQQKP